MTKQELLDDIKFDDELMESFQLFDTDGDGHISIKELLAVISSVGQEVSIDQAKEIMNMFDIDGDGFMDFGEFKTAMKKFKFSENEIVDADLLEAFCVFDVDGDGLITIDEVMDMFRKLGNTITRDEAHEIMCSADANHDGFIDFAEFKTFYCQMTGTSADSGTEQAQPVTTGANKMQPIGESAESVESQASTASCDSVVENAKYNETMDPEGSKKFANLLLDDLEDEDNFSDQDRSTPPPPADWIESKNKGASKASAGHNNNNKNVRENGLKNLESDLWLSP